MDSHTGSPYVVWVADGDGAWVAHLDDNGGEYHAEVIGGTCGSSFGYCDMVETSCESPGTELLDGAGDCGMDEFGFIACGVVHWTCI